MSNRKSSKSKEAYGSNVKRSEYDDGILRNNQRTGNRLKIDMTYYDRAQKVIMKDLGKESLLLQNKLDNNNRTLSMGLYGSKFGETSSKVNRKYTPTSPVGTVTSSGTFKPAYLRVSSKTESRFPWDKDISEKDSTVEKESGVSNNPSPLMTSKSSIRFRTPSSSAYPSSRMQTDDFLQSILNDAMNDELLYTQRPQQDTLASESLKPPNSSRRKSKTPRSRSMITPNESLVNSLVNAQEADEVIY
ncbi:uncharacterized protein LOC123540842 [Mercenaria mercenaria]|uniref:uncharacterized protein LOC123540842 n=1 Tax=Mercenaria mercenaria TaxID=6596 RepID=UPI00234F9449|nr:uncharacterized protein LOC123540842 [Mercenaria mercenaria]XP_045182092.2 uncharacterized protein LOC123540842 [Mercenaria mercenaria]XP_045182093.2 uncharacterized protein LOC123540842 [Mercenaria mercenaria]